MHSCWSDFLGNPRTTSRQNLFLGFHTFYHFCLLFDGSSICCLKTAFFAPDPVDFWSGLGQLPQTAKLKFLGGTNWQDGHKLESRGRRESGDILVARTSGSIIVELQVGWAKFGKRNITGATSCGTNRLFLFWLLLSGQRLLEDFGVPSTQKMLLYPRFLTVRTLTVKMTSSPSQK